MFRDKCTNTFTKHCTIATRDLSLQLRPNLYPPFFSFILFFQPLLLYHVAFRRFRPPLSSLLPPFISFCNSFHCATIVFFLFFLPFPPRLSPFPYRRVFYLPCCLPITLLFFRGSFLPAVNTHHRSSTFPSPVCSTWFFPALLHNASS